MEITLRVAGDDIRVLISSYSETAEDENTASVVCAYVCMLRSYSPRSERDSNRILRRGRRAL